MRIDGYTFGQIRVDGREYSSDVIIDDEMVHSPWWRAQGHRLLIQDLEHLMEDPPAVLVIGTGYFGRMNVPEETRAALSQAGIEIYTAPTEEAVEAFNRLQRESARVVAALHLTC